MGRVRWLAGVMAEGALLAARVGPAACEQSLTRDEYVPRLEKICKPRAEATRQAMQGVRDDVRHKDRNPIAARKFSRAAAIFGGTVKLISKVPRPPNDVARLKEWFVYLNRQEDY